jgi:large subunit ribosomal protein L15
VSLLPQDSGREASARRRRVPSGGGVPGGNGMAEVLGLESLRPAAPPQRAKRVGRGPGSGHGKTSGKGHKGQKARAGGTKGPRFEGGQMPIQMRIPKRGFTNAPFRVRYEVVNLQQLQEWPAETPVTAATLAERRLVRSPAARVKLLARGEVSQPLRVDVAAASAAARAKIEAAGGTVQVSEARPQAEERRPRGRGKGAGAAAAAPAEQASQ